MSGSTVLLQREGPLWRLTLNRSDKANALTQEMLQTLCQVFRDAANDEDLRVLTITGTGDRVFCAGADLTELSTDPEDPNYKMWEALAQTLAAVPVLTIALLNGSCIGGGLTLALGCDIRLSVRDASFFYPVLKNGIVPGTIDTSRLRQLMGPGRTSMLLMGGCKLNTDEALAWGLVDRTCKRTQLDAMAKELAATALHANRDHLIKMKHLCRGAL